MDNVFILNLVAVVFITFIHLISVKFKFNFIPYHQFESFSGGFGIIYIFTNLIPKLFELNEHLGEVSFFQIGHINLASLIPVLSFSAFYIADHLVTIERNKDKSELSDEEINENLYYMQILFFTIYNFFIGFLFSTPFESASATIVLTLYFAIHFISNDWTLRRRDHKKNYDRYFRYFLSAAVVLGFIFGYLVSPSDLVIFIGEGLVLGAMVLNVVKKEMPREKNAGIPGYLTGLLVASLLFAFV